MATVQLIAESDDESTRIEILDPRLNVIPHTNNLRTVQLDVEPGVYTVRFARGLSVTEKMAIVTKDGGPVRITLEPSEAPRTATAAPLVYSNASDDAQRAAAERISGGAKKEIRTSEKYPGELMLFIRTDNRGYTSRPDAGMSLHTAAGEKISQLDVHAEENKEQGWAGMLFALEPGAYRLRRVFDDDTIVEQIIYVCSGWQTQYFAQAIFDDEASQSADFPRIAIHMSRMGVPFNASEREVGQTEDALRALREKTAIPGSIGEEMLFGKFTNPMLGILGGLLQLRRKDINVEELRYFLLNLLALVGPIPDVVAIGLLMMKRSDALRNEAYFREKLLPEGVLDTPPYFNESWRHICDATAVEPKLMPVEALASVASRTAERSTAWFRWQLTEELAQKKREEGSKRVMRSGGLLSGAAATVMKLMLNALFDNFGITPASMDAAPAVALSTLLKPLQDKLIELNGATAELTGARYTDLHRRIAVFVYPFSDPLLRIVTEQNGKRGLEAREMALSRGRDGNELTKALQIPAVTGIFEVFRLSALLAHTPASLVSPSEIEKFVQAESQGNDVLRGLLLSLRELKLPIHLESDTETIDALQLLSLRYRESAARADKVRSEWFATALSRLQNEQGQPATKVDIEGAFDDATLKLSAAVQDAVTSGALLFVTAPARVLMAPLHLYMPGRLFPKARPPEQKNAKASDSSQ